MFDKVKDFAALVFVLGNILTASASADSERSFTEPSRDGFETSPAENVAPSSRSTFQFGFNPLPRTSISGFLQSNDFTNPLVQDPYDYGRLVRGPPPIQTHLRQPFQEKFCEPFFGGIDPYFLFIVSHYPRFLPFGLGSKGFYGSTGLPELKSLPLSPNSKHLSPKP